MQRWIDCEHFITSRTLCVARPATLGRYHGKLVTKIGMFGDQVEKGKIGPELDGRGDWYSEHIPYLTVRYLSVCLHITMFKFVHIPPSLPRHAILTVIIVLDL